jgi:hypothetical protein
MAFEQLMAEAQMKKDKKEEKKAKKDSVKSSKKATTSDEATPATGEFKYDTKFNDEGWAREKQ